MKIRICFAMTWLILLVSCNDRLVQDNPCSFVQGKVFYGCLPEDSNVKTFIDSEYNIYWNADDTISVFRSSVNECYVFSGETGECVNLFRKADSSISGEFYSRNYAIFPYNLSYFSSGDGNFAIELPEKQTYSQNSFGAKAGTMLSATADSDDDVFYFKNVCGFLRLRLYGDSMIQSIRFTGNNSEKISGSASVTINSGTSFELKMDDTASTEITLDCGVPGVQIGKTLEEATTFWIAVPPTVFTKGFTCEIKGVGEATLSKKVSRSMTISRNAITTMSAIGIDFDSNELLTFSLSDGIDEYEAFDIHEGFVDIQVPNRKDLSNMVASFTHTGNCITVDDIAQVSGKSVHNFEDFTQPVQYVVTSTSGLTNTYTIRLFDLPIAFIETPDQKDVVSRTQWMDGAGIKILETDGTVDLDETMSIRGRGNASWNFPKKPYAIKLDSKSKVLGMKKHKRWCLLANWRDRTLLRNDLAFFLAQKADGLDWTPSGKFVEVFFNGEHVGNYYLCEQIKIDKNRINIAEISKEDISGDALTGGYLLEYDNQFDEQNKFKSAIKNYPVNIKSPDESGYEVQVDYITNYINNLEEMLYDNDRLLAHEYETYLDVNSFIDWWIVLELTAIHEPGNVRSCYMYKGRDGVDSTEGTVCPLKAGPVWDFDMWAFLPTRTSAFYCKETLYYNALFQDSKFVAAAKQRWNDMKSRLCDATEYIDQVASQIQRSNDRNLLMWPITIAPKSANGDEDLTFAESIDRIKSSLSERIQWLDTAINGL